MASKLPKISRKPFEIETLEAASAVSMTAEAASAISVRPRNP
jgi:hypothetical protein